MVIGGDAEHVDAVGEVTQVDVGALTGNPGGKHLLAANIEEGDLAGGGGALHGAVVSGGVRHHAGVEAVAVDARIGGGELNYGAPVTDEVVAAVAAHIHVVTGLRGETGDGVLVVAGGDGGAVKNYKTGYYLCNK